MNRIAVLMVTLGLSLASVSSVWAAKPNPEQAKAIAEIEKLGGRVTAIDFKSPDHAVVGVSLYGTKATDQGLEHLKGLTRLQTWTSRAPRSATPGWSTSRD